MTTTTPRYLRVSEAARYCGMSVSNLNKRRFAGNGPRYSRLPGKTVLYAIEDLDAWITSFQRMSTSENSPNERPKRDGQTGKFAAVDAPAQLPITASPRR